MVVYSGVFLELGNRDCRICLLAIILSSYGKGMVKMSSIVIALASGYILTLVLVKTGLAPDMLMNLWRGGGGTSMV